MITIPESDLVVHELCLGSNIFGGNATEAESHLVMDAYKSHGGNFIDTADMYNQWVEGHVGGESETVIGNWMKSRGNRAEMVIATKVSKMDTRPGLSAKNNQGFKNGYSPRIISKEHFRGLRRIFKSFADRLHRFVLQPRR